MTSKQLLLHLINSNEKKIINIEDNLQRIEKKLDLILEILNKDLKKNCEKMGEHIDFVEKVYDNVKNPLGFICNKVNFLTKNKDYSLCEEEKRYLENNILDEEEINKILLEDVNENM
jgi:hypothetical protein